PRFLVIADERLPEPVVGERLDPDSRRVAGERRKLGQSVAVLAETEPRARTKQADQTPLRLRELGALSQLLEALEGALFLAQPQLEARLGDAERNRAFELAVRHRR